MSDEEHDERDVLATSRGGESTSERIASLEARIQELESENALARERARAAAQLREILDRLPYPISAKDRDGRFRFVNAAMAERYGMRPDQLEGSLQLDTHLSAEQVARIHAQDQKIIDGLEHFEALNYPFWLPDGQVLRFDVTKIRLAGSERTRPMVLTIMHDVTDRLHSGREVARQERFVALGHLVARVAHDLRTPLASIAAAALALKRRRRGDAPDETRVFERIERGIARCDAIVADLLDLSRDGTISLAPVALDDWVSQTVDDYGIHFPIVLMTDFRAGGDEIAIDRDRMTRALNNVISNACEAMLESEAGRAGARCELKLSTMRADDRVLIVVEDSGPGIHPHTLERIKTPLFSSKRHGLGLGLAIVRDAMDRHRGGIDIDSTLGKGTRITLWLPAAPATIE